jgi:DNA polymerase-1
LPTTLQQNLPQRVIDTYAEFRNRYNCLPTIVDQKHYEKDEKKIRRNSLIGACLQFGLETIGIEEKQEMIDLINTGGPFTPAQRRAILDYCRSDVDALERLFRVMLPEIDVPRALLRGRYMVNVAKMEAEGIPLDFELLTCVRQKWPLIKEKLVARADAQYGVYEGTAFRTEKFERYLAAHNMPWPRYSNGRPILRDQVFRDMAKARPELNLLRETRDSLSKLRLEELQVGHDGRNRFMHSAFGTVTGRSTPSNKHSALGPSVWIRGFIKPPPNEAIGVIDWKSQEIGIGAALSHDKKMMAAYQTGDVYMEFAKAAGAVPADATRETHKEARELSKQCMLGVNYGMEEKSLALRIDRHPLIARGLLQHHHETFPDFWKWSDNQVLQTMLNGVTYTRFGWKYHVGPEPNVRSIRNFPMQGNGAEIMRLAVCLGIENGITVCCTLHDAVFILATLDRIDADVTRMRGYMERASEIVLDGFKLQTEFTIVRYPDRYMDPRGRQFWDLVMSLL